MVQYGKKSEVIQRLVDFDQREDRLTATQLEYVKDIERVLEQPANDAEKTYKRIASAFIKRHESAFLVEKKKRRGGR